MKHITLATALIAGLFSSSSALGQLAFGGTPPGMTKAGLSFPKAPVVIMPTLDVQALMTEDAVRDASGVKGPFRFGFNHATDFSLGNSGAWSTLPNGDRVWRLAITCPGAYSINFEFHDYMVPEGAQVFVYNGAGDVLGAFTAESNGGQPTMGVGQLAGERITIEYLEPLAVQGMGRLQVGQVTHAYRDILGLAKGLGDSGSCNNNVVCPEGDPWSDQIRSVALITVGGSGACTGTLINNCTEDGTAYFLTARHCLPGNQNVNNWVYRFNWESPVCGSNQNGPTNQTLSGSTLLATNAGSDMALVRINTAPPASYNVFYSGWDRSGDAPTSTVGIHHPSGDIKKISFDNDPAIFGTMGGAQCWRVQDWEDGTTEPGSSGSGLWSQNGHLIGQLYGGQASCNNNVNDYYGRFDVSWSQLSAHLGNCGPVLDGYDPNLTAYTHDAALQAITNVPAGLCNANTIQPSVTIKNNGTATLTSLAIAYAVSGGGPSGNANWSGSLAAGATTNFQLPAMNLPNGSVTLTLTASSPSGQADQNPSNNSAVATTAVADPGETASLRLTLDNYASETTWQVRAQGSQTVLFSGGPYQDFTNGQLVSADWCLPVGCYIFTLFDDWGDGICCEYGEGGVEILDGQGQVLVTHDGDFNAQASVNFCLTTAGIAEQSAFLDFQVMPNPAQGNLTLVFGAPLPLPSVLTVNDLMGRTLLERTVPAGTLRMDHDLGGQAKGTYLLRVSNAQGEQVRRVVLMD